MLYMFEKIGPVKTIACYKLTCYQFLAMVAEQPFPTNCFIRNCRNSHVLTCRPSILWHHQHFQGGWSGVQGIIASLLLRTGMRHLNMTHCISHWYNILFTLDMMSTAYYAVDIISMVKRILIYQHFKTDISFHSMKYKSYFSCHQRIQYVFANAVTY